MTDFRLRSLSKIEFARMLRAGKKALCCLVSFAFFAMQTMPLLANPVNGTVSAGSANISSAGNTLTVTQTTDKAVIDWRGFDIAKGETTRFVQPSSSSMTLNRVSSNAPSFIDGNLTANGNLVVVNPNGVWFGPNARVDVNGLIASTANISNNAFMNNTGILNFDEAGNPDAAIINDGLITAKDAGLVGLVAPNVINRGIIYARLGHVALASGDTATVDLYGDDLIKVAVSDKVKSQLVSNSGVIAAPGGTIALTAAAGKDIVNSLITVHGELAAPSIREHNGKIIIAAQGSNKTTKQGNSTVLVSGILDASGRNASEHGGSIQITADNIGLLAGTRIDASGSDGLSGTTLGKAISSMRIGAAGGDIRIGGDYLGGGHTPTALNLYVDKDVLVLNDALNSGDAGRTIFWSDGTTQFYGNVYARALGGKGIHATTWNAIAGGNVGDGGFIETSGHGHLDAGGYVDLTSSNGSRGTYFLDPTNITIYGNFAPNYATVITGSTGALSASLKLWVDSSDTTNVNLTYSALTTAGANSCASSCLTANGTSGATTITTSANIASTLQVGQRLRLGAAGSVTAASTVGTDTYTISSISGTTITFSSALTATYTNAVVYAGYASQLTDKSGLGNNATQATAANMPLWISNGFNSIGTTNYSGTSYLNLPNLMSGATAGSGFFSAINAADPPGTASQTGMPFGNWGTGIQSHYVWTDGVVYDSFGSNVRKTAANPVPALTTANAYGVISAANDWRDYINGQSLFSTTTNTVAWGTTPTIGNNVGSYFFTGKLGDVFAYNKAVSANEQTLLNQYISGKWNVALLPPGSGATEVAQATASVQKGDAVDGYSVFTTRYLQRLSQSANISLQSSNNITLDFQGDNMNFTTAGRTLTLTAGNQITTASAGTITTNAAAITLNATNGILINNAFTINSANGAVNINNAVTLAANLSVTSGSGTLTFASTIDGAGGLTTSSTNGATIFNGVVGGTTPITSYTGTGRDLTINQNFTTSGNINAAFTRDITLAATKTITTGAAGALTLTAAGNSVNGTGNLNLNGNLSVGTGALTLLSGVNGTRPSWTATTSNLVRQGATFGTVSIQGFLDTTISRDINSSGNITLLSNRDLTLSPANTLTTSATGALSMTAANGSTAGTGNLTINGNLSVGTGALTFLSGINGTRPSLTVTTTNLVRQGATFGAVSIQGFNAFTLNRILNSTSSVLFANNTTTTLQNNVTSTASTITFSNPVIIAEATSINVSTTNQAITFGSTITDTAGGVTETLTVNPGTSSATFTGAVNGVAITVSAGSATLSSAWGATSALGATSITTTSSLTLPAITAASLSVNASGASSSLQVSGNLSTTLNGGALSLTSGAFIVTNAASTISSTNGAITFNAASSLYLATASAAINSTGGAITFTGTNGIIVGADTSVNSGGGNVNFNQAVTMAAPLSLTLGTGTLTFASTIDGSTPSFSTFSVLAVGAGGGGGGMDAATRGSGGGSGAAVDAVVNASAGAVYTVAVGGGGGGGTNSLSSAAGGAGGVNGGGAGGAAGASGTSGGGGGGGGFSGIYIGGTYYVVAGGGAGGGGGNEGFAKSVGGAGGGTQTSNTGTTSGGVGQSYSGDGGGGGGGGGGFLGGAGQTGIAVSTAAAFTNGGSNYSNPGNVSATITLGNAGSASAVSTGGGAATILAGRATFYGYGNNLGVGGTAVGSGTAGTNGTVIIRYTGTTAQSLVVGGTTTTSGGDVIVTYTNTGTSSSFSPISGCSGNCNLTINAGTVNFGGNVGSTQALDAVSVTSTNGLTLPNITASSVIARTTGVAADLTIAAAKVITASGSGDAIKLAAGRNFINNAGSAALATPSGRWLVYSTNPSNDTIGGLSNSFRRFSCTYGGSCPSFPGTGNGLLYSTTPLLTITPNALSSIVYGAAAPNLSGYAYTATGYLGSDSSADTLTGSLTGSSSYIAGSNIGTYNINYGLGSLSSVLGYGFSYANNASAFTVTPRPITITADAKTKTYGAADPSLTYQLTSGSLYGSDSLTGTIARTAGETVTGGPYAINQNTLSAGSNYTLTYVSDNLSITPAALTVTAAAKTKTYGAADPALTYTYSGLTNGDTASVFTGALSRTAGETVTGGPYTINQNTLSAGSNYTISYTGNNLSITQATLNITANALSKTYGAADPTLTYTYSGLTNGDTASVFTGALQRVAGETVAGGPYAINQNTLAAGSNYTISYTGANFTIDPATLTVTAAAKTKTYGAADPALTYTYSGLTNGDTASVFTGALQRVAGENVGSYGVAQNTLSAGSNYTISYTGNNLSITPATLTVTAAAKTKTYGAADPALTYTYSGLTNGDTASVFTGGLQRVAGENVGSYGVAQNTLSAGSNYTISYTGNNLSITPATLNITANTLSKTYGAADPTLTYSYSGLTNGDTASVFTGALQRVAGENVGSYGVAQNTLTAGSNYTISYTGANFTINPATLTVTAAAKTKTYGAADPTLTYTYSGLTNGDTASVFTGALSRAVGETVAGGPYAINQNTLSAGSNYTISYTGNNLSITPATLTVTVAAKTKTYGTVDPALTYTYSGLTNGDTASVFTGALSRIAGETVAGGPYTINQNTLSAGSNYTISYTGNNLSITPAALTVTAAAKTKTYGAADPALTYTYSGLTNGDTASVFTGALQRVAGETVAGGPYAINQNTLSAGGNYTISYTGNNLSITPAALTVTAAAKTKTYGAADPALTYSYSGLTNGDTASVFTGALQRVAGANVGSYGVAQNTLTAGSNYTISYTGANFTINPAPLTVTAAAKTKTYGAADPALTYTYSGLTNGDTASVFTGALQRVAGETVTGGPYAINQNTLSAGSNYTITYTGNNLSITPATLNITANALSKVYGTNDPTLTYTMSGGTNIAFTGALSRAIGEAVNSYAVSQGTLSAGNNYHLNFVSSTFAITPATLYVAANSITKVYGAVDPALTYSVSGLANGDILGNVLTGTLSRESGTMVGSYRITKHTLASNSANYTLDYTSALFNIISNDIPVTVTRVSQDPTLNMPTAVNTTEPSGSTTTQSQTSTTNNNPNISASEVPTDSQGGWLRISPALAAALGEAPVFIKY